MQLEDAIGFSKGIKLFDEDENLPLTKDLLGVELEYEGVRFHRDEVPSLWTKVDDGSLRDYGLEYIFEEPLYGSGIIEALMNMAMHIDTIHPKVSYRCSVHVHLNVSDMSVDQLLKLITLYLIFERGIIKYHGGIREENIFCVPFYLAPSPLQRLASNFQMVKKNSYSSSVVRDSLHRFTKYYALNIGAVAELGSLEFRHMAGTTDMSAVLEWIKIIQYLKKAALEMDVDYISILDNVSGNAHTLIRDVFHDLEPRFRYQDMIHDMMLGARLAQTVIEGEILEEVRLKGRNAKVSKSVRDKIKSVKETAGIVGQEESVPIPPIPEEEIRREQVHATTAPLRFNPNVIVDDDWMRAEPVLRRTGTEATAREELLSIDIGSMDEFIRGMREIEERRQLRDIETRLAQPQRGDD